MGRTLSPETERAFREIVEKERLIRDLVAHGVVPDGDSAERYLKRLPALDGVIFYRQGAKRHVRDAWEHPAKSGRTTGHTVTFAERQSRPNILDECPYGQTDILYARAALGLLGQAARYEAGGHRGILIAKLREMVPEGKQKKNIRFLASAENLEEDLGGNRAIVFTPYNQRKLRNKKVKSYGQKLAERGMHPEIIEYSPKDTIGNLVDPVPAIFGAWQAHKLSDKRDLVLWVHKRNVIEFA